MKRSTITLLVCLLLSHSAAQELLADTAAEILEKGIYAEETVGDLDEAIKLYRQVVVAANETERVAANAQFRLGQCLLKKQKKEEAIQAFRSLIKKYPEQTELVAKAKKYLPGELKLGKAPWKDGERASLELKLPGGQVIGLIGTGVDSAKSNGKNVWKMHVRRFVAAGQNEGVSLITVDQKTNRPLKTTWDHTVLGTKTGVWDDKKLVLTGHDNAGKKEEKTIKLTEPAFSNDQVMFGMRQLPLAVGYKVTFPIRVAFTGGNQIDFEIEVSKMEKVKTRLGEYECFRLETNIQQTFWISNTPERYLVRFEAGGVDARLASVTNSAEPVKVENKSLGFSFQAPKGWHVLQPSDDDADKSVAYQLVAPTMASTVVSVKEKSQLNDEDRASLQVWADSKIARGGRRYKAFNVRDSGKTATKIAGREGVHFAADFGNERWPFVINVNLATTDTKAIAIANLAKKDQVEKQQANFEATLKSFDVR